jgi:hypothetical protein
VPSHKLGGCHPYRYWSESPEENLEIQSFRIVGAGVPHACKVGRWRGLTKRTEVTRARVGTLRAGRAWCVTWTRGNYAHVLLSRDSLVTQQCGARNSVLHCWLIRNHYVGFGLDHPVPEGYKHGVLALQVGGRLDTSTVALQVVRGES